MRNLLKATLIATLFVALIGVPAMAKKAPVERTVIEGVTLAEVKPRTQMQPYYPATARVHKAQAEVIVSLQVLEDGKVGDVEVLSSSVEKLGFEQSAADAVKQWRFHPALQDGEAIETVTLVRLTFGAPTLRSPEGFTFVETSPRHHAVAFMTHPDKTWTEEFRDYAANHHTNRDRLYALDLPPCQATSRAKCLYDKSDMVQFGEGRNITPVPPTPPPGDQPTMRRGLGGR